MMRGRSKNERQHGENTQPTGVMLKLNVAILIDSASYVSSSNTRALRARDHA